MDIVPHTKACVKSLMANIKSHPELNMVKKVHRFTHRNLKQLETLFSDAGLLTPEIRKAIAKVTSSCIPCTTSGHPILTKKVLLKHVNKEFNLEVREDFMTAKYKDRK